jgi:hypothetical protein
MARFEVVVKSRSLFGRVLTWAITDSDNPHLSIGSFHSKNKAQILADWMEDSERRRNRPKVVK